MDGLASGDFAGALLALSIATLKITVGWALVVALLNSWNRTAGMARALTPPALRFLLAAGVWGALAGGGAAHANDLDGLRLPERPVTSNARVTTTEHIVRAGDSLWAIAADTVPDSRDVTAVARETRRWYDANRETVGRDPNLIRPGQRLMAPPAEDRW